MVRAGQAEGCHHFPCWEQTWVLTEYMALLPPYTHGLLPLLQPCRAAALTLPCLGEGHDSLKSTLAGSARPGLLSSWARSVLRLRWPRGPPPFPIHLWLPTPWGTSGEGVREDAGVLASIRLALWVLGQEAPGSCGIRGVFQLTCPPSSCCITQAAGQAPTLGSLCWGDLATCHGETRRPQWLIRWAALHPSLCSELGLHILLGPQSPALVWSRFTSRSREQSPEAPQFPGQTGDKPRFEEPAPWPSVDVSPWGGRGRTLGPKLFHQPLPTSTQSVLLSVS